MTFTQQAIADALRLANEALLTISSDASRVAWATETDQRLQKLSQGVGQDGVTKLTDLQFYRKAAQEMDGLLRYAEDAGMGALQPFLNLSKLKSDLTDELAKLGQTFTQALSKITTPSEWPWYAWAGLGIGALAGVSVIVRNLGVGAMGFRAVMPVSGLPARTKGKREQTKQFVQNHGHAKPRSYRAAKKAVETKTRQASKKSTKDW